MALEASLAEHRARQAVGARRQQDLEYELGRAWEELERAEATAREQRAQHEEAAAHQEERLGQARQVRTGWQAVLLDAG